MSSLHRSLATSALLASAASVAFAGSEPSTSSSVATERGFLLSGELMVFPAADQGMPQGWSLISEATLNNVHQVIRLQGTSDVIAADGKLVSVMSRSLSTGDGQLALTNEGGGMLELGNLALAFSKDGWNIVSLSDTWGGRPVFELAEGSQQVYRSGEGFSITGELVLSSTVLESVGIYGVAQTPVVGALTLIASPMFNPATPVVANAPAPIAAVGPDVIVSTIGSTFGEYGAVGNIGAYAFTTVSCNIGDAEAIWIDTGALPNRHPVIGQQLYRYKTVAGAGRFEQIGTSWLKHGFCAADAPNCGTPYTPNGSCDWLGLFATDTYSDGLNAQQSNLAPRSEVQPWTGAYAFPWVLNGCGSSTTICKRLQVDKNDLDPALNTGATYWGDCVYITTDESTSTRFNNYSYRQATVGAFSGGQYNLSFSGSTVAQQPAINRWAVSEAGVTLVNVDIPGDGRFVLAYKTTNLGGGQYHYEYALLNMNSDRSGQAFEVPLGAGATVSNVGYHDVDYHSGEPYINTDWTPTTTLGVSQKWAGGLYATNVNSNALRWSQTYNFRMDSNAAPVAGNVTLTLFKPGSPTTVTIAADVPGGATCGGSVSTYCTTSLTSNFCQPQIGASGTPSASAVSGFTIDVTFGEAQKSGLFFFGLSPIAVPWALGSSSYRCVSSPVQRTPVQNSGGTLGFCDGTYSLDWNDWRNSHPTGLGSPYIAGDVFYGQYWFRDPPAVSTSNLTNAVTWTLCN